MQYKETFQDIADRYQNTEVYRIIEKFTNPDIRSILHKNQCQKFIDSVKAKNSQPTDWNVSSDSDHDVLDADNDILVLVELLIFTKGKLYYDR
jgi:hypothetical protein